MLIIGSGKTAHALPKEVTDYLHKLDVSVEVMDTLNASHTFNVLNQEGRFVAAALLPSGR